MDRHRRTILKTITWRVIAFLISFIIVYIWTGRVIESVELAIILNIIKMLAYYIHERVWNNIKFGKL
jgi:uncharacterized membrane protein